jgi:hypothetical protein
VRVEFQRALHPIACFAPVGSARELAARLELGQTLTGGKGDQVGDAARRRQCNKRREQR